MGTVEPGGMPMRDRNYTNRTKLKSCVHCQAEFTAKEKHHGGYQDYCPTCVEKKVYRKPFKFSLKGR